MTNDHTIRWARISIDPARATSGQKSGTTPHSPYAASPYAIPRRARGSGPGADVLLTLVVVDGSSARGTKAA